MDAVMFSRRLSWALDHLGYGPEQRQIRKLAYRELDLSVPSQNFKDYTVGSKGEGITCIYESDRDVIIVNKNVVCVDALVHPSTFPSDIAIVSMETICEPGHVILLVNQPGKNTDEDMKNAVVTIGDTQVISSDKFMENVVERQRYFLEHRDLFQVHDRAGPSAPLSRRGKFHIDMVWSLRCLCPSYLYKWYMRPRSFDWPSQDVRNIVFNIRMLLWCQQLPQMKNRPNPWSGGFVLISVKFIF